MVRVGIVGGLGPESTIVYYRRIIEGWWKDRPNSSPEIVIDSLDVQVGLKLVATDPKSLVEYLMGSLHRLAAAQADFCVLAANTPHIVFDELAARSPKPLLSIVEVCAEEAARRGFQKLILLGTRFTMEASFYLEVFARRRMTIVTLGADKRLWLHERYVGELLVGVFHDETRRELFALVERLQESARADAVILGGTELPFLLQSPTVAGLPTLDTTALHVAAIVERLKQTG